MHASMYVLHMSFPHASKGQKQYDSTAAGAVGNETQSDRLGPAPECTVHVMCRLSIHVPVGGRRWRKYGAGTSRYPIDLNFKAVGLHAMVYEMLWNTECGSCGKIIGLICTVLRRYLIPRHEV